MAKYPPEKRPPPTPKKPNLWDRPEPVSIGDDKPERVYEAVGFALTTWEQLEHQMGTIFVALTAGTSDEATRAYGAITATKTRLELVNAAAEAFFLVRKNDDCAAIEKNLSALVFQPGPASH
jgi:hypothetical protein